MTKIRRTWENQLEAKPTQGSNVISCSSIPQRPRQAVCEIMGIDLPVLTRPGCSKMEISGPSHRQHGASWKIERKISCVTFYILYQYLVSWGKLGRYRPGWFHCLEDGLKAATGKYRSFSVYAGRCLVTRQVRFRAEDN